MEQGSGHWQKFIVTEVKEERKEKWAGPQPCPKKKLQGRKGLVSHVNAGELEVVAINGALDGDVVTGMSGNFVLSVNGIDFLVGVIDEDILGTVFLDALGGAIGGAFMGAFRATSAVGYPTRPSTVSRRRDGRGKQKQCRSNEKTEFQGDSPQSEMKPWPVRQENRLA
jgi:hypothetical protein